MKTDNKNRKEPPTFIEWAKSEGWIAKMLNKVTIIFEKNKTDLSLKQLRKLYEDQKRTTDDSN